MVGCRIGALYAPKYLHDIFTIGGSINVDVWEDYFEQDDVVGWTVDDITFSRGFEVILKYDGDIFCINGEVVRGCTQNGKAESRARKDRGG